MPTAPVIGHHDLTVIFFASAWTVAASESTNAISITCLIIDPPENNIDEKLPPNDQYVKCRLPSFPLPPPRRHHRRSGATGWGSAAECRLGAARGRFNNGAPFTRSFCFLHRCRRNP